MVHRGSNEVLFLFLFALFEHLNTSNSPCLTAENAAHTFPVARPSSKERDATLHKTNFMKGRTKMRKSLELILVCGISACSEIAEGRLAVVRARHVTVLRCLMITANSPE